MSTVCSITSTRDKRVGANQLFRRLRLAENRARRAGWRRDLGHCDNLLENLEIVGLEHRHQLVSGTGTPSRRNGIDNLVHDVPLCQLHPRALARCRRQGRSAACRALGRWVLPKLGRALHLVPLPRSWPASVSVGPCGGPSRPRALRRLAFHGARTGVTVAAAFERLTSRWQLLPLRDTSLHDRWDVHTLSMNCNCGESAVFCTRRPSTCRCKTTGISTTLSKNTCGISTVFSTSCNCGRRLSLPHLHLIICTTRTTGISTLCQRNATAEPQISPLSDQSPVVCTPTGMSTTNPRTALWNLRVTVQFAL